MGSDRTIKEISGSVLLREIDLHTLTLSSISMSAAGAGGGGGRSGMLFTGSTGGRVQVCQVVKFHDTVKVRP